MAEIAHSLFHRLSYLVIDDSSTMRSALRITITTFGGSNIDLAAGVFQVLHKMDSQGRQFDIILCDYNLGDERDGQQLLEELRFRNLLRRRTVFIMVTGERQYERVVQAVEHAPDDYLIKPFPGVVLRDRLLRQLEKKVFFGPVFDALDADDPHGALEACNALEAKAGRFGIELARMQAEICVESQQIEAARAIYHKILEQHELPWARYGLARLAYLVRDLDEAVRQLDAVIAASPRYLAAQDFLARIHAERGDTAQAQAVLAGATAQAGRNLARRRELGMLALQNDDLAMADECFQAVLQHGRHSIMVGARDHVQAGLAAAALGRGQEALKLLADAERQAGPSAALSSGRLAVEGQLAAEAGMTEQARTLLLEASQLADQCSAEEARATLLAGLRAAGRLGDSELARSLTVQALRKCHCDPETTNLLRATMRQSGMDEPAGHLDEMARHELASMNNRAVNLAKAGQLREAMEILVHLAHQKAASTVALLNAAQAVLMCMDTEGWNDDWAADCARFIGTARERDASNQKIPRLEEMMRNVAAKYGVRKLPRGISL